jgi:hypothetical protein
MSKEVGLTYPTLNRTKGLQNYVIEFNNDFFDGLYYIKAPSKTQKTAWTKSQFNYGLYVEANVAFLLMEFPTEKISFITPINLYDAPEKDRTNWLSGKTSVINLFLINADNNVTEAIRTFKVDTPFAQLARTSCQAQIKQYKNSAEVNTAIQNVMKQKNFAQMKTATKMVTVLTII